jgi:hypothetical protein
MLDRYGARCSDLMRQAEMAVWPTGVNQNCPQRPDGTSPMLSSEQAAWVKRLLGSDADALMADDQAPDPSPREAGRSAQWHHAAPQSQSRSCPACPSNLVSIRRAGLPMMWGGRSAGFADQLPEQPLDHRSGQRPRLPSLLPVDLEPTCLAGGRSKQSQSPSQAASRADRRPRH